MSHPGHHAASQLPHACSMVASNPLYNAPGERLASPTEGSQTASNGFTSACGLVHSVSSRPLSNPLFDPQDSASCHRVRPLAGCGRDDH